MLQHQGCFTRRLQKREITPTRVIRSRTKLSTMLTETLLPVMSAVPVRCKKKKKKICDLRTGSNQSAVAMHDMSVLFIFFLNEISQV